MEKKLYAITFGTSIQEKVDGRYQTIGYEPPKQGWINVTETPKTYKVQAGGEIQVYRSVINKSDLDSVNNDGYIIGESKEEVVQLWNAYVKRLELQAIERHNRLMMCYKAGIVE